MRIWHAFLGMMLLSLAATNAAAQKVTTDFDHAANFSQYHTFYWAQEPQMSNPLAKQRVMEAINRDLTAKGWQLMQGSGDVAVVANGVTQERQTLDTFYNGMPGWRWGFGGMAETTTQNYRVGTLVVDLLDAKSKQAIWRGTATDTLSDKPEKNDEKIDKSIDKMFKNFPPEEKH
jgi:hypothetical protein